MKINITGHVYVIQGDDGGPVKIGISSDPRKRLSAIQAASGRLLSRVWVSAEVLNPRSIEASMHGRFRASRSAGEWFDVEFDEAVRAASEMCEPAALLLGTPSDVYLRGAELRQQLRLMADAGMVSDASLAGFAAALSAEDISAVNLSIHADIRAWESLLSDFAGVLSRHGLDGQTIADNAASAVINLR